MIPKVTWLYNWVTRLLIASTISTVLTLTLWAMCTVSAQSLPTTITVTNTNDSGPGSLRAALAAAGAGGVVQFSLPASATIVLTSGELAVDAPLTIDGSTVVSLTVSGNHGGRVFSVTAPLTIRALPIADGVSTGSGGGINTSDALTLTGVHLVNNTSGVPDPPSTLVQPATRRSTIPPSALLRRRRVPHWQWLALSRL